MTQSRRMSLVEALAGTAIGYLVAVATQFAVFPLFGLRVGVIENLGIGLIFTVVSVARSYLVRRLFEGLNGTRTRGRAEADAGSPKDRARQPGPAPDQQGRAAANTRAVAAAAAASV